MQDLERLYMERFPASVRASRDRIWKVLCEHFFQRWVGTDDVVLDLACGFGEFSRFINAGTRIAVDLNPAMAEFLPAEVRFICSSAAQMPEVANDAVDVCFTSNFFEHLPDKPTLDAVLQEVRRVLRPGGRFIVVQPNISYVREAYWDFIDHVLPLNHHSLVEGFHKNHYQVERLVPRFLPYTTRSRLPQHPALVRLYLAVPLAWRILGKQLLLVARKPD